MHLSGGGAGGVLLNERAKYDMIVKNPNMDFTVEGAKILAAQYRTFGWPIPVAVQKSLAKAGLEITAPGTILLTQNPTTQAAVTVGVSTPQAQAVQSAAIQAAITPAQAAVAAPAPANTASPMVTPSATPSPPPPPQPSVLNTPNANATTTSAPINFLPADTPIGDQSIVPGTDNKTLLLIGAGIAALFLFGKKRK